MLRRWEVHAHSGPYTAVRGRYITRAAARRAVRRMNSLSWGGGGWHLHDRAK